MREHFLYTEKYRPQTIDECVLPESIKAPLKGFIKAGNIPNILMVGKQGTGKTTAAEALCRELGVDVLKINASLEGNIDTLRNEILRFASSMSMGTDKRKYVILDECLDENTLVWILRDGVKQQIKIAEVLPSTDLVMSFNVQDNKIEWKPFDLLDRGQRGTLKFEFENGEVVICTPEHKWYVYDDNNEILVVPASELYKYNYILTEDDQLNEE